MCAERLAMLAVLALRALPCQVLKMDQFIHYILFFSDAFMSQCKIWELTLHVTKLALASS